MRILIAGATGAIGRPLVRRLRANQHEVFALARSPDSATELKEIGAEAIIRRTGCRCGEVRCRMDPARRCDRVFADDAFLHRADAADGSARLLIESVGLQLDPQK